MENWNKVLVTAATGFIGSHLARRLIEGGFEVGIIKRENSNAWRINDLLNKIVAYDVDLRDTQGVSKAVSHFRPDVIFHLATYYTVEHKPQEVSLMVGTNVSGVVNLLEASRESMVKFFVNTSSCFIYRESKSRLRENDELNPLNLYALTKIQVEQACPFKQIVKDIRDISEKDLQGVTVIIHLAALSNDPLGEINPSLTHEINYFASVKLANLAKKQGIQRFIFSSSCSLYGIAPDDKSLTEEAIFNPITAYAKAKAETEKEILKLAENDFHPVFMRNVTVYGISPSLRLDLVVNNLVARAYLTGEVAIMSDGTPWRPIIHVEDLCRAFLAAKEAHSFTSGSEPSTRKYQP